MYIIFKKRISLNFLKKKEQSLKKRIFKKKNLFFKKKYDIKILISRRFYSIFKKRPENYKNFKNKQTGFFIKKFFLKTLYHNRKLFKLFFTLNKKFRQKKLTKLIFKKSKKLFKNHNNDYTLNNILLRCHFFFFHKDVLHFIKNNLVFVNGIICNKLNYCLTTNDILQIPINKIYFNYLKVCKKFFRKKLALIRYNTYKYYRKKHYQSKKYFRIKKRRTPNYNLLFIVFKLNTPKFLEVDFLTLTIVILKKLNLVDQSTYYLKKLLPVKLYTLYNYKKIN